MDFLNLARPEDLVALQWFIITVLIAALVYQTRELRKCNNDSKKQLVEFLTAVLEGLAESSRVTSSIADALDAYQQQLGIVRILDNLERLVQDGANKKD